MQFFVLFAPFWFKYVSLRFHQIAKTSCCTLAVAKIRISVYLDDGIRTDSSKASCSQDAQLVRGDLDHLGLLVNEEKSNFELRQKGEHSF